METHVSTPLLSVTILGGVMGGRAPGSSWPSAAITTLRFSGVLLTWVRMFAVCAGRGEDVVLGPDRSWRRNTEGRQGALRPPHGRGAPALPQVPEAPAPAPSLCFAAGGGAAARVPLTWLGPPRQHLHLWVDYSFRAG